MLDKFESKILSLKNEELSYYVAREFKGANIKEHDMFLKPIGRTDRG